MGKKVARCVYERPATKTLPAGFEVQKFITDQWGERRKIHKIFRPVDDTDAAREEALADAKSYVRQLDREKRTGEIFRRFDDPLPKPDPREKLRRLEKAGKGPEDEELLDTLVAIAELDEGPRTTYNGTLRRFVEEDYLPWIKDRNSKGDYDQKKAVWSLMQRYGDESGTGIQSKTLRDTKPEYIDGFVEWLENRKNRQGNHYSKRTINRYFKVVKSIYRKWSVKADKPNPAAPEKLHIKPSRIKGRQKQTRVVSDVERLHQLTEGFEERIQECDEDPAQSHFKPKRLLAKHIHHVLMYTGLRPSEAFYLRKEHIDFEAGTIKVEGAAVKGEAGLTKTGKKKRDKEAGTKVVPVLPRVLDAIRDWLDIREEHGFGDTDTIFADDDGSYLNDRQLRGQYKGACKAAGIERITPYQMRHSLNDLFRRIGVPEELRALYLGQSPESGINRNYTDVKISELRKHLSGLEEALGS